MESHCDALIVLCDKENVIHALLPGFTLEHSGGLQNVLNTLLGSSHVISSEDRTGQCALWHGFSWEVILSTLWKGVVKPVLAVLDLSVRHVPLDVDSFTHQCLLQVDPRRFITHFLVPNWAFHVSSHPCRWLVWCPVFGTWP